MKIYCRVEVTGLVPMYDSDYDEKTKLHIGDNVLCTITQPRNYKFHKKFFALIRLTYVNLPERLHQMLSIYSEEDMLDIIKMELGLYTLVYHGGKQIVKLGSISFASMDNTEFEKFYQRAVDVIINKFLRGICRQDLIDNVNTFK